MKVMIGRRRAIQLGLAVTCTLGPLVAFTPAARAAEPGSGFTTVATGFDNPRGLAFGEDGRLYVAEAGSGGPTCATGGPGGGSLCIGLSSGISVITDDGAHHRILSDLASTSGQGGFFATGADGLSSNDDGHLFTVMTECPQVAGHIPPGVFDPSLISSVQGQLGQVLSVNDGGFRAIAGVGAFDWNWSSTHMNLVPGQFPDCNPYGILAGEHGHWVVDAASNTLDRVGRDGTIEIVAFFPNPPVSDAVPTCLARGPDGALYVGELTGNGNTPGSSVVWRVDTGDEHPTPTMWATGLTAVTGCGFADGSFYATEFSTLGVDNAAPGTGAVVRVPPHSTTPVTVANGLSFPNGFVADEANIYVSNWSIAPAVIPPGSPPFQPGEVVRIGLHHDE